jgi:site-specific DNA-methyltransferase (adenine-specific)
MLEPAHTSSHLLREPSTSYARNSALPTLFGEELQVGSFTQLTQQELRAEKPTLFYQHPRGQIWVGDTIAWLRTVESEKNNA